MTRELMLEKLLEHLPPNTQNLGELCDVGTALAQQLHARGPASVEAAILELDELVHECMDNAGYESHAEASAAGSQINNDGIEAQIACILAGNGPEGEELIREAVGLPVAASLRA